MSSPNLRFVSMGFHEGGAPPRRLPYKLTPHVAVDDATFGALHLIAALQALGRTLPC